jgi:hypothetical protein
MDRSVKRVNPGSVQHLDLIKYCNFRWFHRQGNKKNDGDEALFGVAPIVHPILPIQVAVTGQ